MKKRFQISFAVAVLLGYTSAQLLAGPAPTIQQQAIQTITRVDPALVTGTVAPTVGTPAPTQQDLLLQQIQSFQPDVYLDQVLGLAAPAATTTTATPTATQAPTVGLTATAPATTAAPVLGATATPTVGTTQTTQQQYAALVKTDLMTKLQAQKDQMLLDYIDEMVWLQADMAAQATKLQGCNWACVDTCALTQTALTNRVACLEQCGCYGNQYGSQQESWGQQAQAWTPQSFGGLQVPQLAAPKVALHSHLSFLANPLTNTAVQAVETVATAFATQPTTTTSTTTTTTASTSTATTGATVTATPTVVGMTATVPVATVTATPTIVGMTATVPVATVTPVVPVVPVDPYVALQQQHDAQRLLLDQQILAAEAKLAADELAATAALATPAVGTTVGATATTSVLGQAAQTQAFALARKALQTQAQQQRQLLQLDFEAQEEELEFAEEEKNFAATSSVANAYLATLPKNIQDLYAQHQQKERQMFERERLAARVQRSLNTLQVKKTGTAADFQIQIDQAAAQLGCDPVCVSGCSATQTTLNGKSNCLDTCMCYLDPTERAQMAAFIPKYAAPAAVATTPAGVATTPAAQPQIVGGSASTWTPTFVNNFIPATVGAVLTPTVTAAQTLTPPEAAAQSSLIVGRPAAITQDSIVAVDAAAAVTTESTLVNSAPILAKTPPQMMTSTIAPPAETITTETVGVDGSRTTTVTDSVTGQVVGMSAVGPALSFEAPPAPVETVASALVEAAPIVTKDAPIVDAVAIVETAVATQPTVAVASEAVVAAALVEASVAAEVAVSADVSVVADVTATAEPTLLEAAVAAPVALFNYTAQASKGLSYSFMAFLSALFIAMIGVALYIRKNAKRFNLEDDNSASEYLLLRA